MRAGLLRHRVAVQQRVAATSDMGTPVDTWETVATVWGAVEPLSGTEALIAHQAASEATHRVRVRGLPPTVRPDASRFRVEHKGRLFDVNAVLDQEERNIELHLLCREGDREAPR
ncbi:MAG: head-tail adaptor protein [Phycisphaerales bacterium]|nr:MAG: head-tail adaptor protein [Phycisphaerales bacterium]